MTTNEDLAQKVRGRNNVLVIVVEVVEERRGDYLRSQSRVQSGVEVETSRQT